MMNYFIWTRLCPHALVNRVAGINHIEIPYAEGAALAIVYYIGSILGAPVQPSNLLHGRAVFMDTQSAMNTAQERFRQLIKSDTASLRMRSHTRGGSPLANSPSATCSLPGDKHIVLEQLIQHDIARTPHATRRRSPPRGSAAARVSGVANGRWVTVATAPDAPS